MKICDKCKKNEVKAAKLERSLIIQTESLGRINIRLLTADLCIDCKNKIINAIKESIDEN